VVRIADADEHDDFASFMEMVPRGRRSLLLGPLVFPRVGRLSERGGGSDLVQHRRMRMPRGSRDEVAATPAQSATPAEIAKSRVKPASVGMPATALAARTVAETCEPRDEPTERTSALKPVASPVWCAGTASMIRFGMAANARPMPA
jgi:hypothetical protein